MENPRAEEATWCLLSSPLDWRRPLTSPRYEQAEAERGGPGILPSVGDTKEGAKSRAGQRGSGWQEGGTEAVQPSLSPRIWKPKASSPCHPHHRQELRCWRSVGKRAAGTPHHLLAAIWSARSFPEAGTAQEVPSERAALAPHRRVAEWVVAPGTQCPWHGGQPSHHKSPFVLTPLALKRQVTRLHWAQGPDCGLCPCSAGLAGFREGAS